LFGFGKAEQVVPLSFKEGILSFSCSGKYKVGKSAKIKLTLVYGEAVHTPTVAITVIAFEPTEDGTYLCQGALDISASKLPGLVMQMAYAGVEGADRRASRRLPYTIRILSKELSSFRAVTTNINVSGTELNSDNPVAPGHYMNLQFDLESVGFPELKMQAVCVWSLEEIDEARKSRYRVGVGFTNQHPETHAAWAKFYRSILATEGASVMLKTIDGGSVADKKAEGGLPLVIPPPPPPPAPSASSSGQWTSPPTGNPFATQEMPAPVPTDSGGYPIPSPQQSTSQLNFVAPPAAVPPSSQMGGGFNTQAAPPPPLLPNKLALPPAGQPQEQPAQPPGGLSFPSSQASTPTGGFSFPSSQPSPGFQIPPSPPQQSGFGFPSSAQPSGFQIPPSQPPPQQVGFGFPAPPQPSGGFQIPPSQPPPQQVGFGFPAPSQPSGGFQIPPSQPPPQQVGFGFPAPSQPSGGFQMPGSQTPPQQGGFGFPAPSQPSGFQIPPSQPPTQQVGFGFPAPSQPGGGFQIPPSPPPPQQAGFGFPTQPGSQGGFSLPPSQPEQVQPLGISGANLAYRGRSDEGCRPGTRKQVQLSFNVEGRLTAVVINVGLSRVEPSPDGTCVCWCTVLEDEQKIQVLNQLLGS
jgi:hypothetical protein